MLARKAVLCVRSKVEAAGAFLFQKFDDGLWNHHGCFVHVRLAVSV